MTDKTLAVKHSKFEAESAALKLFSETLIDVLLRNAVNVDFINLIYQNILKNDSFSCKKF